jgi:hypothetical protein
MVHDAVNAVFEALAGAFVLNHLRVLLKDRQVRGVSLVSSVFFLVWGCWNTGWYYAALRQPYSLYCGLVVVLANAAYVAALVWFKHRRASNDGP